jgi:hypothetical protein
MVGVVEKPAGSGSGNCRMRVLYVGPFADNMRNIFERHAERISPAYAARADEALFLSRNYDFDAVIMDQRDAVLATRLILPLIACFDRPVNLLVISALSEAEAYSKIPGSARIIPVPVRESWLLRALDLDHKAAGAAPVIAVDATSTLVPRVSAKAMSKALGSLRGVLPGSPSAIAFSTMSVAVFALLIAASSGFLRETSAVAHHISPESMATSAIPSAVRKGELEQLAIRIERARRIRGSSSTNLALAQSNAAARAADIRELLGQADARVVVHERKIQTVLREREKLLAAQGLQRNMKDLRARRSEGLIDNDGVESAIKRMLAIDERLAKLDTQRREAEFGVAELRKTAVVLNALLANFSGKPVAIMKPVAADLLPLVKSSAQMLAHVEDEKRKLGAAVELLQLLLDKRMQLSGEATLPQVDKPATSVVASIGKLWQQN